VPVGSYVIFSAPDETVEGTPVTGPVEWTVSGGESGTITSAGLFQATDTGGYTVRARRSGKTGHSKVTVTEATAILTSVRIAPDALTLQPGATFTFAVSGLMSDGATVPVTGTWTATGGTIDNAGAYHAGTTAGQFRVIVTQQGGTLADTAAVTISTAAPTLQAVEVTPTAVSLAPGAGQQRERDGDVERNRRVDNERGSLYGRHHSRHLPCHCHPAGWYQGRHSGRNHHPSRPDPYRR
jgi:hypothetical protein